ncbi:putative membrane protein [Propionispora sp. 2/2-37]|uniref:GerAB/ArcD/ProY family transporter n=1 Tax=Propionispora sp. 2/2-37 TaxID=1677858 RepID=UPI0006C5FD65|nr:GerAB/ArcD/ProY family transporter [Propionispora sp. 2/2-37]CUH95332.1 putative membrane protein [Propionispora sp. 2/2-37]
MERIDKYQLFCLIAIFEIGSTTLFALGIKAKQDAWLTIIIAMFIGIALVWAYTELQKYYPDKNLAEIIIILLGKPLGIPLSLLYAYYFIESSVLNFSEFGFLIKLTLLPNIQFQVIEGVFLLLTAYFLMLGVEVIGRTAQITLPTLVIFLSSIYLLTILSGSTDLQNIQPVLGNGIEPILKAVYPDIVIVPFGESVLFLMFWSYVNTKKNIRKISILALGVIGFIILCSIVIIISVLGVNYAGIATIPLLEVVKSIKIGEVITNFEPLAISNIFLGGFYKALLNLLGGIIALSIVCNISNRLLIIPVVFITFFLVIQTIPNLMFHRFIGWNVFARGIHVLFQIYIPILLLLICWLRRKRVLNICKESNDKR